MNPQRLAEIRAEVEQYEPCETTTEPDECGIPGHTVTFCAYHRGQLWPCDYENWMRDARDLLAERDALQARIGAALALHSAADGWCFWCDQSMPCSTVRTLRGES